MKKTVDKILNWLEKGERVGIVCTVSVYGSAPGKIGSMMAATLTDAVGTIGGGALEAMAIDQLRHMTAGVFVKQYNLDHDAGMICGGTTTLLFYMLTTADKQTFETISHLTGDSAPCSLAILCDGARCMLSCIGETTPLHCDVDESRITLCIPMTPDGKIYLFGGGHVSHALSKILDLLDQPYVTVEDRPDYNTVARFPNSIERIVCPYNQLPHLPTAADFCVILTQGHSGDYDVLAQVLSTPCRYIGLIGSRKKWAATVEKLSADGFSQQDIARIHSPIGLNLGGPSPAEIAVAISAQIIMERSGKL